MNDDKHIETIIKAACILFSIKREDIFKTMHERQKVSLARKCIFYYLVELKYDQDYIIEYFSFSKPRFKYLYESACSLAEQQNKVFNFNLNSIKRQCGTK